MALPMGVIEALHAKDVSEAARLLTAVPDPAAIRTRSGMSLLHLVYLACHCNCWLEMTRMLVEQYHCDMNARDAQGQTTLHYAVSFFGPDTSKDQMEVAAYLVSTKNCNLDGEDKYGNTPLHLACQNGNSDMVKLLLDTQKCDVNCRGGKW